jgi:hypothetical protein
MLTRAFSCNCANYFIYKQLKWHKLNFLKIFHVKRIVKDLHPSHIIKTLKASFKAVFSGDANNEQFIEVFITILFFALLIVSFFVLKR